MELESINSQAHTAHSDATASPDTDRRKPAASTPEQEPIVLLSNWNFFTILSCLSAAVILCGYDSTCVATLTPIISDEFGSLNDVSWYGIAYSLASCATVLSYAKLYSFYRTTTVLVASFIVGRVIAGLGNSGILSGTNITLARIVPLHKRAFYQALIGGVECVALAVAPFLSGCIAEYASWRVCFYICLPLGVIPIVAVLLFLRLPKTAAQAQDLRPSDKLRQLDLPGMALFVPWVVCLVLALQWGGSEYTWTSKQMITLFALVGTFLLAMQEHATLPLRLLRSRVMLSSMLVTFATSGALYVFTFYVPLYNQAVRGVTTMESGLRDLSRILGLVCAISIGGIATNTIGYYMAPMLFGAALMIVGAALTTTFDPSTALSHILIYQAILGIGCGLVFQQPYTAAQASIATADVNVAIVIITFAQLLGSVVMLAVAQNVFSTRLAAGIAFSVPGLDPNSILNAGATSLRELVPMQYLAGALEAYNGARVDVFYTGLAIASVTTLGALGSGWKSVKQMSKEAKQK
ncbi:MFS general substrate transporter [Aspergillus homomorphus CBS 101889]|uniref:MFS general substrate transporter n=1 Tax=Aspergillus homomorphus (strain CBS 101889) TaxID=1450537 RepID=A0A395HM54_ASPHC|nr:MFS general substrate transporter [Aspergillus homomorphus CBS 101889]RAL08503.1 MFS general substrate transporter [Aspergillus homomorphus CBS 101889]